MFPSIRARLTFFYAAALAVLLAGFGAFLYFATDRTVRGIADDSIEDAARSLITTLRTAKRGADGPTDETIDETLRDFRFQNIVFAVFDDRGRAVALSPRLEYADGAGPRPFNIEARDISVEDISAALAEGRSFSTIHGPEDSEIRIFAERAAFGRGELTVTAIRPLTPQIAILSEIRLFIFAGIPVALLLSSIGGYYLAGKSLGPVSQMAMKAARITSSNLSERLPRGPANDELAGLADTFNDMLDGLENAFAQQKRFMADASHELRTPLAIIRGESDVALQKEGRSEAEYRESLGIISSEGVRLSKIVDDLFILAKTDSGSFAIARSRFYIDELVQECVRSVRTLVEETGKQLAVESEDELMFTGDEDLMRRMIVNLLDNAVKYSDDGGKIRVECRAENGRIALVVSNSGPPISARDAEHIFDRFYRTDKARSHDDDTGRGSGAGLGLPIARSVAAVHGGTLELVRSDSEGTVFKAVLPAG